MSPSAHPSCCSLFRLTTSGGCQLSSHNTSQISFLPVCCRALVQLTATSCQHLCSSILTSLLASSLIPSLVLHGRSCPLPAGTLQWLPVIFDFLSRGLSAPPLRICVLCSPLYYPIPAPPTLSALLIMRQSHRLSFVFLETSPFCLPQDLCTVSLSAYNVVPFALPPVTHVR